MKVLGIIPARGGSKGVLRKNLRMIGNYSLIEHSVRAAKGSELLSYVVGSTEDEEMKAEFRRLDCPVVERPADLAQDSSPVVPVIQHVLQTLEKKGLDFDWVILLQTTCPFRDSGDIDEVIKMIHAAENQSFVSVYQVEDNHPARMYRIEDTFLVPIYEETASRRRQELEPIYHRNGAIYACTKEQLFQNNSLISQDVKPYIMPQMKSFNIDNEVDLFIADQVYKKFIQKENS